MQADGVLATMSPSSQRASAVQRKYWVVGIVILALAVGGTLLARGRSVEVVEARQADLTQTVVASGRIITPVRVQIGSVMVGTLATLNAREGDKVGAGKAIATLRDDEQRAALAQARAALVEAEARVGQLKSLSGPVSEQGLKQSETNLVLAKAEFERIKRLYEGGFFSKSKLDEASRNLDVAQSAVTSAQAQAESNRPRGSDFALALSRLDQARAAVKVAEARLENTVIRAPSPGVILQRFAEPGDVVPLAKNLFTLLVNGETQIVAQVDEKNLALLAVGQKAQATPDAYPGQRFDADVFYVAPSVDAQRGTVEVKLRVAKPPEFLKPDMTVSVEIVAGRAERAIVVDSDAVREATSAAPWVLLAREGRAERRAVKLGLRGAGATQIAEGLAAGDLVIPASQPGIAEGQRVRPEAPRPVKKPVGTVPNLFQ